LPPLDSTQTSDFYELVVERHSRKGTIWVSNGEPVDRLTSGAHHLIIEGPSYR